MCGREQTRRLWAAELSGRVRLYLYYIIYYIEKYSTVGTEV